MGNLISLMGVSSLMLRWAKLLPGQALPVQNNIHVYKILPAYIISVQLRSRVLSIYINVVDFQKKEH